MQVLSLCNSCGILGGDGDVRAAWKARTPDKPLWLAWVCGEVRRATRAVLKERRTPDEPKRLVWVCREIRRATMAVWRGKAGNDDIRAVWKTPDERRGLCGKKEEHQTSYRGSSGCVE